MRTTVAVLDKCGENAVSAVVSALAKSSLEGNAHFELATSTKSVGVKNVQSFSEQKIKAAAAAGSASTATLPRDVQMLKMQDATVAFEGRIYSSTPKGTASDVAFGKIQGDYEKAASAFLGDVEGDFALIIVEGNQILAVRDLVGVQPLYFGETQTIAAIATNRKTLWKLGVPEPKSFPPGHLGIVTKEGFKFKPVRTLEFCEPRQISMEEAAKKLQKLLEQSIKQRIFGLKEVAVAFSGGLDSSVVACLASRCGGEVHLIHVSLEGQLETDEARKAAELLGLPLQVHLFEEADLEMVIPKVVDLIEESDPIKASVGVPFFWNAQKAAAAGYKVLLAGQGADELFGGYQRYVTEYLAKGEEAVRKTMFQDVAVIHESNIERDEKICDFYDVELRLPFASYEIAEFAMSLPTELKFERKADSLRKLVLRKVAANLQLPPDIAQKPKKAVQYSTGVSSSLKKLAKKKNLTLGEYIDRIFQKAKSKDC